MIYCFDIDGTICSLVKNADYTKARPYPNRIKMVNQLYDIGHTIKYFTARGTTTGIDWQEVTKNQLKKWGAKYHELIFGKPEADFYIDDKGIQSMVFSNILFDAHIHKKPYDELWMLRISNGDIYNKGMLAEGHN